jgi:hypothetical protein
MRAIGISAPAADHAACQATHGVAKHVAKHVGNIAQDLLAVRCPADPRCCAGATTVACAHTQAGAGISADQYFGHGGTSVYVWPIVAMMLLQARNQARNNDRRVDNR